MPGILSMLPQIGQTIGSIIGKKSTPSGTESGQFAKDHFDTLAPGTSEWERIGASNPSTPMVGGKIASQQADRSTDKNLAVQSATQLKIAKMQTDAQKEVAYIQSTPAQMQAEVSKEKLPHEVEKIVTETNKLKNTSDIGSLRSSFEKKMKEIGVNLSNSAKIWAEYIMNNNKKRSAGALFEEKSSTPRRKPYITVGPF